MKKKKIIWITGSSFIDVDLPIVPRLKKYYDITWFVVRQKDCWFSEQDVNKLFEENDVVGEIVTIDGRLRSFASAKKFFHIVSVVKKMSSDIIYINYLGVPYLWPMIFLSSIDRDKIVYPCHDFIDHVGVKNRTLYSIIKKVIFRRINKFQFFSKSQQHLFHETYQKKRSFYAPLYLKGFGDPITSKRTNNQVVFLFFGSIRENKGLEYLIEASNILYHKYAGRFQIKICGSGDHWNDVKSLITHQDCFDIQIRRIENDEIAKLFSEVDYLVLPYLDVTQSGPLLISYYYNVPVIASDLPGFQEYILNKKNGFLFAAKNSESLASVMAGVIENGEKNSQIKCNLKMFVEKEISIASIINKYRAGFEDFCRMNGKKYNA